MRRDFPVRQAEHGADAGKQALQRGDLADPGPIWQGERPDLRLDGESEPARANEHPPELPQIIVALRFVKGCS